VSAGVFRPQVASVALSEQPASTHRSLDKQEHVLTADEDACLQLFGEDNINTDWNDEFQSLYDLSVFTPHEISAANSKKRELFDRFMLFSRSVAEQLVRQLSQPIDRWIIRPIRGAGWAGGEKFKVGNLFCKFARDDKGLYGGNDERAVKMAKNEIRCGNALLQLRLSSLHLSMMVCHRVHGHAIITTALIPITGDSLVYGSCDAARTVHRSLPLMNELVDRAAAQLNLMPHSIANQPADVKLSVGVDCEGHVSQEDGRL